MKTDTYFWPKGLTADPYMKQFIEKTRYLPLALIKKN